MIRLFRILACFLLTDSVFLPRYASAQLSEIRSVYSTDRVSAFRVRSNFDIDLDEDQGWAAAVNIAPSQTVDSPFRIRFEVESDSSFFRRQYSLQFRWNNGPWTYIKAHEFPYESAATPPVSIVSCEAFFLGIENQ